MQTVSNQSEPDVWKQIAALLDTAIAGLNETDRHAVVLRFIYGKSMKEVGAVLGGSEGAAKLRLHRDNAAGWKVLPTCAWMFVSWSERVDQSVCSGWI